MRYAKLRYAKLALVAVMAGLVPAVASAHGLVGAGTSWLDEVFIFGAIPVFGVGLVVFGRPDQNRARRARERALRQNLPTTPADGNSPSQLPA